MSRVFSVKADNDDEELAQLAQLRDQLHDDDIVAFFKSGSDKATTYAVGRNTDTYGIPVITLDRTRRYQDAMLQFREAINQAESGRISLQLQLLPTDAGFCARFGACRDTWPLVKVSWVGNGSNDRNDHYVTITLCAHDDSHDDTTTPWYVMMPFELTWVPVGGGGGSDANVMHKLEADLQRQLNTQYVHVLITASHSLSFVNGYYRDEKFIMRLSETTALVDATGCIAYDKNEGVGTGIVYADAGDDVSFDSCGSRHVGDLSNKLRDTRYVVSQPDHVFVRAAAPAAGPMFVQQLSGVVAIRAAHRRPTDEPK